MDNEKLNELLKNVWDSLTDEQKEKAKECKTADELVKLADEEGIELPDELLDAAAGGLGSYFDEEEKRCNKCGEKLPYNYPGSLCKKCKEPASILKLAGEEGKLHDDVIPQG